MKKKIMRNPVRRGFTLIELVVAMAVFSLMMLMMMRFFVDTQRLWSKSEDKANMYADARIAMDLMASALQSVYYQESGGDGQHNYHQERFYISSTADNNANGAIVFPVNLSRNSPLYPSGTAAHTDFAKPFYIQFWLDNNILRVANDNGVTSFVAASAGTPTCNNPSGGEEIVGNITSLNFRLFTGNFTVLNNNPYTHREVFPHSVQITMKMMPKAAYDTWVTQGRDANAQQVAYREENEYEFVRIVYLGVDQ